MTKEEFESNVRAIRPKLIAYASSLLKDLSEAEDAVQDTLLRLWSKLEYFRKYKSFEAVAFVSLRHIILNKFRTKGILVSIKDIPEISESVNIPEEYYGDEIIVALDSLPNMEQTVLRMKHIEDMETEEIASLIGSNPVAVRQALSRARKKLRDRFVSR